ncbi:hypothetical protein [Puniceicoccus vermicola]|uniref:Uncharacterized protein n=1 Tax=Puniceicoccus vermicola TaxID=388746 RepID=A0A7X1AYT7_9BACT|nr:hypothetical protein [Puniceicoccus vermicola]MBC2602485.1 hypothetical protein [Puniceicoccus vermicola]
MDGEVVTTTLQPVGTWLKESSKSYQKLAYCLIEFIEGLLKLWCTIMIHILFERT